MDYVIKNVATAEELGDALAFSKEIFADRPALESPAFSYEKWLARLKAQGDLILYAERGGKVVGIVFGAVEDNGNLTIEMVAVDERFRKQGLAREMMLTVEERAKAHGVHLIALGALQSAEGFYSRLGYTGSLLIQSEQHSIGELLSLNKKYPVRYTNVYDGKINQVCLELPEADRELQREYETTLPGCHTQMMFWKNI